MRDLRRCGELHGGLYRGAVWLACWCSAQFVYPANAPPPQAVGDSRK